jgi:hypothetical protein
LVVAGGTLNSVEQQQNGEIQMTKMSTLTAVITLFAAVAMPVFAQDEAGVLGPGGRDRLETHPSRARDHDRGESQMNWPSNVNIDKEEHEGTLRTLALVGRTRREWVAKTRSSTSSNSNYTWLSNELPALRRRLSNDLAGGGGRDSQFKTNFGKELDSRSQQTVQIERV